VKFISTIVIALFLTSCATGDKNSSLDNRALKISKTSTQGEQRVALVIGNRDYTSLSKLKNPINDARAMRNILSKKSFSVIYLENASQLEMEEAIDKFAYKLKNENGVGMFYYAGHGMEVEGKNYLIPTNAKITSKKYVKSKSVSIDIIVSAMEEAKNRLNILVLDSCRNDPFNRSGTGGLAPINSAKGIYVAYATAPNKVAEDGEGENGLFTQHLIKYINQEGLKIEDVFKKVRTEVRKDSNGNQIPWSSSSIEGDFYFTFPKIKPKKSISSSIIYSKKEKQAFLHDGIKHSVGKDKKNGDGDGDGNAYHTNGKDDYHDDCEIHKVCHDGLNFPSFNNYIDTSTAINETYKGFTDERYFLVGVTSENENKKNTYTNVVRITVGKPINVRTRSYIHNNGNPHKDKTIAKDVTLKLNGFTYSGTNKDGKRVYKSDLVSDENGELRITQTIKSSNTSPISDDVIFKSINNKKFKLQYIVSNKNHKILGTSSHTPKLNSLKFIEEGDNIGSLGGYDGDPFFIYSLLTVVSVK
jgi:hypothetical protein